MAYIMTYSLTSPLMAEGVSGVTGLPAFQTALLASLKQWLPADLQVQSLGDETELKDEAGNVTRAATFGEETSAAVHQLKFWLGYPAGRTQGVAGPQLQGYVYGTRRRSPAMYALRALRLRRRINAKRLNVLHIAQSQIGVKEWPKNSNRVKYSAWYGMVGPWCAMFQTWCADQTTQRWPLKGARFAYVPYLEHAAAAHQYLLSFTSSPIPGDIVTYDWDHDGVADHVGIFEAWHGPGVFTAIEGNTSTSDQSNGGEVMRRTRYRSEVHRFIRVSG